MKINYGPAIFSSKNLPSKALLSTNFSDEVWLGDHLGGFTQQFRNYVLDHIQEHTTDKIIIWHDQLFTHLIKEQYPNFKFELFFPAYVWDSFKHYNIHPELNYTNFLCSFNGSVHVSRVLLTAILNKFKFFNAEYSSKNYIHDENKLSGYIRDYAGEQENFYSKFFINSNNPDFFQTIYSFGLNRYEHSKNIYTLEKKLTQSFLHLVSETLATSYYPFVSEKFLYSVVTRGLFLAYAQPGWHAHLETHYGFKKYTKLFDYRFDTIQNPIERLVELMTMISKFSHLTPHEWHDLYLLEQDTIEYNYDHYFGSRYLECLKQHK